MRSRKLYLFEWENPEEWRARADSYYRELAPLGPYQESLVLEMLQYAVNIDRSYRIETALLSGKLLSAIKGLTLVSRRGPWEEPALPYNERVANLRESINWPGQNVDKLDRTDDDNEIFRVMSLEGQEDFYLRRLCENFEHKSQMLSILRKYRTGDQNGYYRALHELQRDQARMRGEAVPAPATVDVNVNYDKESTSVEDDQSNPPIETGSSEANHDVEPEEAEGQEADWEERDRED